MNGIFKCLIHSTDTLLLGGESQDILDRIFSFQGKEKRQR